MFTGIDEVDWAALRHAYGTAEDVPGLLRGLASPDAAEREVALDGMYGSVHHQGNVYDSTLACVPFLFALASRPEVPDRGAIVELLVSIGAESAGPRARAAVRAGAAAFVPLAADACPGVRRAAAGALVRFLDGPARVLALLRRRIAVERDEQVLLALIEALGLLVRHRPAQAAGAVALLAAQSGPPYAPTARLAALGQLGLGAPERLPGDLVPTAVRLLRERSERRAAGGDRVDTDTLVGRIRRLRPSDEEGSYLLRTLHRALDDRVADRIALLVGQLSSPDPMDRCNAVRMSAGLFRGWRADFTTPVELIGRQLGRGQDQLRDAAVSVLAELFGLAAPAADELHALVTVRPDLWVRTWERGRPSLGGPLKALARSGDPRAVPALSQLLARPVAPAGLGFEIAHLGPAAAPLAPALRHRLGRIDPDSPRAAELAAPLLAALTALKDPVAVPEVLRLLRGAPDGLGAREALVGQAVRALDALGTAARAAAPVLRGLLDTRHAAVAAGALWSAEGEADAVLPVLLRELTLGRSRGARTAAGQLGRLGPAARDALPALHRLAGSGRVGERTAAAEALWRIGGDPEPVLPVFRTAWSENPCTRGAIAGCLAAMGPAGAPLRDLLTAELATARRHTARPGGFGSHDIAQDERLLSDCRQALASQ
ncbi:HEAT repeat domain-containing protein [Streptomyces shenzhenensis]|uniref:HEAT repeat domain-containing protein n=1 Tax=Streptomyces shenzhenensis TaxID=943815 RepID=UPI001F1D311F|nr:HEAT repeat domain-containing protein [Streptomyces shenzhenensis]